MQGRGTDAESQARALSFSLGTGATIVHRMCQRVLETLQEELVIVTCFWAASASSESVSHLLLRLSEHAEASGKRYRIRLCLSSVSLLQKLLHPSSQDGYVYRPHEHAPKLDLPFPEQIPGIDLQVKSIFVLPFSVMHPKYLIIDRSLAFLPSCNVSWEDWFEGALEFEGQAVTSLFDHWSSFWARDNFAVPKALDQSPPPRPSVLFEPESRPINPQRSHLDLIALPPSPVRASVLPSMYHRNPRFGPFPFQRFPPPPKTELNMHTLNRLSSAKSSVFVTTPNVTSQPFTTALMDALSRGVHVHIVTNDRLMTLEQLVTAGTTTPRCMKKLIHTYSSLARSRSQPLDVSAEESVVGCQSLGRLRIEYFRPELKGQAEDGGPVKLHLKLMIVDGETVLLGSGNQDRASWYTSQELGLALTSEAIASSIYESVVRHLDNQTQGIFAS